MSLTLYARLGGYDAIATVSDDLLTRLKSDAQLGRFWHHRGEDGVQREQQLIIDFLCASAGGPLYYTGRDMKTSHRGMGINEGDWRLFIGHLEATLGKFNVPAAECAECSPSSTAPSKISWNRSKPREHLRFRWRVF